MTRGKLRLAEESLRTHYEEMEGLRAKLRLMEEKGVAVDVKESVKVLERMRALQAKLSTHEKEVDARDLMLKEYYGALERTRAQT